MRERDSRPELRKEEVEQSRADPLPFTESRDRRRAEQRHRESRDRKQRAEQRQRAETKLTGGGGSEKQRGEERESGVETKRREIEWLRKVREKKFKFEIYAKRRRFCSPRTGPVPNLYWKFFFFGRNWVHLGYACSSTPAVYVPTTYPVPVWRPFCRTSAS